MRVTTFKVWFAGVIVLLGPSLLVWLVRGGAMAASCAPGTDLCRGLPLGEGMRLALTLAWSVGDNTILLLAVALVACIAALFGRRPLLAAGTLLLMPLAALILPMSAVYSAIYPGCDVSEAGVGDCTLWGAQMGMSFHAAASVPWQIYGFAPYSFSLALMLGTVGWFLTRTRPMGHATASNPHRFADDRFSHHR